VRRGEEELGERRIEGGFLVVEVAEEPDSRVDDLLNGPGRFDQRVTDTVSRQLITQRSLVQIQPPQPTKAPEINRSRGFGLPAREAKKLRAEREQADPGVI
jgi:hypothetical protein